MKRILTKQDMEWAHVRGQSVLYLDEDTIVTSIAREEAGLLGIHLVSGPAPALASPSTLLSLSMEPGPDAGPGDISLENGHIVIPELGVLQANLLLSGSRVAGLTHFSGMARQVIDLQGRYVIPGIIDPHVHLGLFGPLEKELRSELASALLGGVTTVGLFLPRGSSYRESLSRIGDQVEANASTDVFLHLPLFTEEDLAQLPDFVRAGCESFKFYLCGIPGLIPEVDDAFLLRGFRALAATQSGLIAMVHAENISLVNQALQEVRTQGKILDLERWSATHPPEAEEEAILRASYFAAKAAVPLYLVHVSSRLGVEAVRRIKKEGNRTAPLYAETTSPYLSIDTASRIGALGKMIPPFRSPDDRDALWQACLDHTLDTVGTDNVTMTRREKQVEDSMCQTMPGFPALATHWSSLLTAARPHGISLLRLAEMTSTAPAKIFGLYPRKGTLLPGSDADFIVVNPEARSRVSWKDLHSRSDFSLFEGSELYGWPEMVWKAGVLRAQNATWHKAEAGGGRLLRPRESSLD